MAQLSAKHVTNTLQLLADVAADRTTELEDVSENISDTNSDDDYESPCPVHNSFYKQGQSASILQLTGFDACEFQDLGMCIISVVLGAWNKGRGKRTQFSGKVAYFMTLVTMKNGGTWDFPARVFSIKALTFERVVLRFVTLFSETIYDKFVLNGLLTFDMASLQTSGRCFKNYPCARYATDVTFQQAYPPSGAMEEGKKFYSGKHKLYGYKVEVSVLPIGISVDCTDHYPGIIADIDIFYNNLEFHKSALSKKDDKGVISVPDVGPLAEKYQKYWAVIVDKGYQGLQDRLRAIHPTRKPCKGNLTLEKIANNKDISSDRIIVENWFGRLCVLWNICSSKWKWSEQMYDPFFKLCAAMTNYHVRLHPLRASDLQLYRRVKQRQYIIGEEILRKRKRTQEKYRKKRKHRLAVKFCEWGSSSESTVSP